MKWEDAQKVDSNLMRHALHEFSLIPEFGPDAKGMDRALQESMLGMVDAFSQFGHSGFSAEFTRDTIDRLLSFQNLTPLTDNPSEWREAGYDLWQNTRNSKAFSSDGGRTYSLIDDPHRTNVPSVEVDYDVEEEKKEVVEEEENSFKQGKDV